jgi:hypothetical protein
MCVSKHTHADHATYAAFHHRWLAQLDVGFISRGASGVVGVLRRLLPFLSNEELP